MKLAALFSGGKDSTYSIYKATQLGHDVKCLITLFPKSPNSHLLHFPNIQLTELQSETMNIPHIVMELETDETNQEMKALGILLKKSNRFRIRNLFTD